MNNAAYQEIIERYIQAYNAFDIPKMTQYLHRDIVFENISNGVVTARTQGIEEFTAQAQAATQYFRQRKQTAESFIFQEDTVIVSIDYKAILAIDLPSGLRAGDVLELKGTSEFTFFNGSIIDIKDRS